MSVTNYTPSSCSYSNDKLKKVVYLLSESHVKNIHIDNGDAYIDSITESPYRLECLDLEYTEETSLDERYVFTKNLVFTIQGYFPLGDLGDKYYAIIESLNGSKWMVNVDFPAKVTYTYNLSENIDQTEFTFGSISNFPTLPLTTNLPSENECKQFAVAGIKKLKLLERNLCDYGEDSDTVYTYGKSFVDVDWLGNSISFSETYDGNNITSNISFDITLDSYKASWHYNLLEFINNKYAAIITPKGDGDDILTGFNNGLQPSFRIGGSATENGKITITLSELSTNGSVMSGSWSESGSTTTHWQYITSAKGFLTYECLGYHTAKYLMQEEQYSNGKATGRYKVLEGYAEYFPPFNIVDTFNEVVEFEAQDCLAPACVIDTDIPTSITFRGVTCNTYSLSASCDWNTVDVPSFISVTPSSGEANTLYSVDICNTQTITENTSTSFGIDTSDRRKIVNIVLNKDNFITPSLRSINCLQQNVLFNLNDNISITSMPEGLTYTITNSQLIITVPRNYSTTSAITYTIGVKDYDDNMATVMIAQDKTFEQWINTTDFICDGSTSYVKQIRYTGTTSNNINTPTGEFKMGAQIESADTRCMTSLKRWVVNENLFICLDGGKWNIQEEQIRYNNNGTWTEWTNTGAIKPNALVEADSSWCEGEATYEWRLTTQWQCEE